MPSTASLASRPRPPPPNHSERTPSLDRRAWGVSGTGRTGTAGGGGGGIVALLGAGRGGRDSECRDRSRERVNLGGV
jgi:hypothetical protein